MIALARKKPLPLKLRAFVLRRPGVTRKIRGQALQTISYEDALRNKVILVKDSIGEADREIDQLGGKAQLRCHGGPP
jgi:hypothetical protein